jgi:SMC interacting uncharacterized protein involved in chromosome segregation
MMATTPERLGIVETKVQNLEGKIDELKEDVHEGHKDLKTQLETMYDASCSQHAALAKELNSLKQEKDKWVWFVAGAIAVMGWVSGHTETIMKFIS